MHPKRQGQYSAPGCVWGRSFGEWSHRACALALDCISFEPFGAAIGLIADKRKRTAKNRYLASAGSGARRLYVRYKAPFYHKPYRNLTLHHIDSTLCICYNKSTKTNSIIETKKEKRKIRIKIDILDRHMWNVLLEGKFRLLHTERGI